MASCADSLTVSAAAITPAILLLTARIIAVFPSVRNSRSVV